MHAFGTWSALLIRTTDTTYTSHWMCGSTLSLNYGTWQAHYPAPPPHTRVCAKPVSHLVQSAQAPECVCAHHHHTRVAQGLDNHTLGGFREVLHKLLTACQAKATDGRTQGLK